MATVRPRRQIGGLLFAIGWVPLVGCASLATVRSAEVAPGPRAHVQFAATTPVGDATGWFFSHECESDCSHGIVAADLNASFGTSNPDGLAYAVGGGLNGVFPYLEGYLQLGRGHRPVGLGARLGIPITGTWALHQLHGRLDLPLGGSTRVLLNPGLSYLSGASPNGENPGSMLALSQSIGLAIAAGRRTIVPSVTGVVARSSRTSYGGKIGSETTAFLSFAVGIALTR